MTKVTAMSQAKRDVYRLLEASLIKSGEYLYVYKENTSDAQVLEIVALKHPTSGITLGTVTGIRSRAWGGLYKEPVKTDAQRIADLEEQVRVLTAGKQDPVSDAPTGDPDNLFN